MVEIKWQDPPAALTLHESIVAALKSNPGRWALVAEDRSSSSSGAKWSKSGCETKLHRKTSAEGKPQYDVYARWPESKGKATAPAPAAAAPAPAPAPAPKPVEKKSAAAAVATGTALVPPAPTTVRKGSPAPTPANDMGLTKFLADRRARGAVARVE